MGKRRCEYCHEYVDELTYPIHVQKHLKRREDGQQTEYATLPPEERFEGDIEEVPTVYVHLKCGGGTGMPDEIVRSYLKNPWLYTADATFCTTCRRHVPFRECEWVDTGENLQTYFDRLRAAKPELKPQGCFGMFLLLAAIGVAAVAKVFLA